MRTYGKSNYVDQMNKQSKNGLRARAPLPERAYLSRYRVIQRDLVYVIGIPIDIANEEILSRYEYFGQYGPIKKIVVNSQTVHTNSYQKPTVSAYVTFQNIEDAWECLYALESFSIGGHLLKASFGTSKYCSAFLSGQKCTKPDCMYLHYKGDENDSFATDEIQQNSERFSSKTRPLRPPDYLNYEFQIQKHYIFPPRRILKKQKAPLTKTVETKQTEIEQPEEDEENSFLNSLFAGETIVSKPLKVDYSIGQSLNDQLNLSRPSIRSVMFNDKK